MESDGPTGAAVDPESTPAGHESFDERVEREWRLLQPQPVVCCSFPRTGGYIGNNIWIWGADDAMTFPFKCIVGPDWPCVASTYLLIIVVSSLFIWGVAFRIHVAIGITSCVLLVALLLAFSLASCSDPGIVRRIPYSQFLRQEKPEGHSKCGHCHVYRPRGTAHCYECDVCVAEIDHHCPWTGHCIGRRNLLYFKAFVTLIMFQLVWIVVLAVGFSLRPNA